MTNTCKHSLYLKRCQILCLINNQILIGYAPPADISQAVIGLVYKFPCIVQFEAGIVRPPVDIRCRSDVVKYGVIVMSIIHVLKKILDGLRGLVGE